MARLLPLFALAFLALFTSRLDALEAELVRDYPASGPSAARMRIVGATDLELMEPVIKAFMTANPGIGISYVQATSLEVYSAVYAQQERFDLVISSAMDLQTKLVNDGYARPHRSAATLGLPSWANWRERLFAFTEEPAVIVYSDDAFPNGPPSTRGELLRLLRAEPERFAGRIATYDPAVSGLGYLFATQDVRQSETFWSLAEVFGQLGVKLFCCSGEMIDKVKNGELLLAYNVLGPYAERRRSQGATIEIIEPEDYTQVMLRTALIPRNAENPEAGARFIDFLLSPHGRRVLSENSGLPALDPMHAASGGKFRPIVLGPGLLVYLDAIKKRRFLDAWAGAVVER